MPEKIAQKNLPIRIDRFQRRTWDSNPRAGISGLSHFECDLFDLLSNPPYRLSPSIIWHNRRQVQEEFIIHPLYFINMVYN